MKFQVLGLEPFSGTGKTSGKPFSMLKVKGVVTGDDGVIEVGEIAFFENAENPLPKLVPGAFYEPVFSFEAQAGKLNPRVVSLRSTK